MPSEPPFLVPTSAGAAIENLGVEGSMAIAGGTSVALLLKNRLVEPTQLVYLARVPELAGIELTDTALRLGAMTSLHAAIRSPLVGAAAPILAVAAGQVGNPRVRSMATIGGGIAHADSRQDVPPALLALDAYARLDGPAGERIVPMRDYFRGFMETATGEDELILDVVVPHIAGTRSAYNRFTPNSFDDYPVVAVAAVLRLASDGSVDHARIALGGVDATAILVEDAASVLIGQHPDQELFAEAAAIAARTAEPTDDRRGSADYKRAMIEVWVRRTLEQCVSAEPN